jgi:hypothetical protein
VKATTICRIVFLATAILPAALRGGTALAAASCKQSWWSISASIEFVSPEGAALVVRHAGRAERHMTAGECLVPGDVISLPTTVTSAKIFTGDRMVRLQPDRPPLRIEGGVTAIAGRSMQYIASLTEVIKNEPTPDLPRPTASRGLGILHSGPLRPIPGLDVEAVAQRIPSGLGIEALIVAWQPDAGEPRCGLRSDRVAQESRSASTHESWCTAEVSAEALADDADFVVRSEPPSSQELRWRLTRAADTDVPLPPWAGGGEPRAGSAGDRAIWGLWLYREGGPEWRLAALGLIYANRERSWLAARTYRLIVAGDARLAPDTSRSR